MRRITQLISTLFLVLSCHQLVIAEDLLDATNTYIQSPMTKNWDKALSYVHVDELNKIRNRIVQLLKNSDEKMVQKILGPEFSHENIENWPAEKLISKFLDWTMQTPGIDIKYIEARVIGGVFESDKLYHVLVFEKYREDGEVIEEYKIITWKEYGSRWYISSPILL